MGLILYVLPGVIAVIDLGQKAGKVEKRQLFSISLMIKLLVIKLTIIVIIISASSPLVNFSLEADPEIQ